MAGGMEVKDSMYNNHLHLHSLVSHCVSLKSNGYMFETSVRQQTCDLRQVTC